MGERRIARQGRDSAEHFQMYGILQKLAMFFIIGAFFLSFPAVRSGEAAEWFIEEDVIGHPPGAGFDQTGNLYYYSNLWYELRIRTSAGDLTHRIGLSEAPFSSTGFLAYDIDVRDLAVAPDGTAYFLVADNGGSLASKINVIGLEPDHETPLSLNLAYSNLQTVNPSQIGVDNGGNLFVLENHYLVYGGQLRTFVETFTVKKYSSDGQTLWETSVNFLNDFEIRMHYDSFSPWMYINADGTTIYIVSQGDFWIDAEHTITSRRNLLISIIDGATGSLLKKKRIGDRVDPSTTTVHDLSALMGDFRGRPRNGAVDPAGSLLLEVYARKYINNSIAETGQYWIFLDRNADLKWERFPGQALHAPLSGLDPDASYTFAFDDVGMLYVAGRQNASKISENSALADTGAFVAQYDLASGVNWETVAPIGAQISEPKSTNPIQDCIVNTDRAGNVYISQGIYEDAGGLWRRFIEKNPRNDPKLEVKVVPGLQDKELNAGIGSDPDLLKNIKALRVQLKAAGADFVVVSITFTSRGTGEETNDFEAVRLLFPGGTSETGTYSSLGSGSVPSMITFSDIHRTISMGTTETWDLEYDFKPDVCAVSDGYTLGSVFVAQLPPAETLAGWDAVQLDTADAIVEVIQGEGPTLKISPGNIFKDTTTDNQGAKKETALPKALATGLNHQSAADTCGAKVWFTVDSRPPDAEGESLDPSVSSSVKPSTGVAESIFLLGDKSGAYEIKAELFVALRENHGTIVYPPGTPTGTEERPPPLDFHTLANHVLASTVVFKADAYGVDITGATHNADPLPSIGTFITNIPATNIFYVTALPEPASGDAVSFSITPAGGTPLTSNGTAVPGGGYKSGGMDMAGLLAGSSELKVTVDTGDGQYSDTATIHAINFPAWIQALTSITNSFTYEFQDEEEKYHVGFSYPVDFAWSNTIAGSILLLGGKQNESNLNFNVDAFYHINQTSALSATGSLVSKVLGYDFSAKGSLSGTFDSSFNFQGGTGTLQTTLPFTIPQKGVSHTVYVYAVPLTVAIDIGGEGKVMLSGSAELGGNLEFQKILIHPAIEVELDATASVAAFYGAAKLGINAKPLTEVELKLLYASTSGIDPSFGGRITIPISVIGSLFWGAVNGTLASTTLGPYGFGTMAASGRSVRYASGAGLLSIDTSITVPEFFSGGDIAGSGQHLIRILTVDIDAAEGMISPDLYFRYFDDATWQTLAPVATEPDLWEMDPTVTFVGSSTALALWTSNDGAKDLADLNDIFSHQDIRYAVWSENRWSNPGWLTKDGETDGMADVSYNASTGQAIAVWFHDRNSDRNIETRSEWNIQAAVFDAAAGTWDTPITLSGEDTAADYMPRVASGGTKTMAVWARDLDGSFITVLPQAVSGTNVSYDNSDGAVFYSVYENQAWTAPAVIPASDKGFVSFPAVAVTADGTKAIAVWLAKENGSTPGSVLSTLYYAVYTAADGSWTAPAILRAGSGMEEVQVLLAPGGAATVLWRTTGPGENGHILQASVDLAAGTAGPVSQVTSGRQVDWGFSAAMTDDGTIHGLWQPVGGVLDGGSGPMQTGKLSVQNGTIGSVAGEVLVDTNDDGLTDILRISVDLNIINGGDFTLLGVLLDSSGVQAAKASISLPGLASGSQTVFLDFEGREISTHNVNGPFTVTTIVLIENSNGSLIADTWDTGWNTGAHTTDSFVPGVVLIHSGDIDGDLDITLSDAIVALKITASLPAEGNVYVSADVNEDSRIGLAEAVYIMQKLAGAK